MKKMNTSIKSIIVLVVICLVIGGAMAAVNMITEPKIAAAEAEAERLALSEVCPENGGFEAVEGIELPESVKEIYRDLDGEGYVAMLSVGGYDSSKPMSVAVGFTNDGKIIKCKVISAQGETSGIGSKVTGEDFLAQFNGKSEGLEGVDAISGATISSSALIEAVRESFSAVKTAGEVTK
ncbi:MAG: FMN-binding protein [Ruminococcaceae bacterium]|nr:FMN-binding protein [Oscillospiraceae bacterium]